MDTIGALPTLPVAEADSLLGTAAGVELHRLAHRREVAERGEAKQVSAETTFDTDLSDIPRCGPRSPR
ncbi:MAG: hypothetical protein WCB57_08620 [Pseudonocardiaceae bacterium]